MAFYSDDDLLILLLGASKCLGLGILPSDSEEEEEYDETMPDDHHGEVGPSVVPGAPLIEPDKWPPREPNLDPPPEIPVPGQPSPLQIFSAVAFPKTPRTSQVNLASDDGEEERGTEGAEEDRTSWNTAEMGAEPWLADVAQSPRRVPSAGIRKPLENVVPCQMDPLPFGNTQPVSSQEFLPIPGATLDQILSQVPTPPPQGLARVVSLEEGIFLVTNPDNLSLMIQPITVHSANTVHLRHLDHHDSSSTSTNERSASGSSKTLPPLQQGRASRRRRSASKQRSKRSN